MSRGIHCSKRVFFKVDVSDVALAEMVPETAEAAEVVEAEVAEVAAEVADEVSINSTDSQELNAADSPDDCEYVVCASAPPSKVRRIEKQD